MTIKKWLAGVATVVAVGATLAISTPAHADIPCGYTSATGPSGATVFRTASGWTPKSAIPPRTRLNLGKIVGSRVYVHGWNGYIAKTALNRYPGATCW